MKVVVRFDPMWEMFDWKGKERPMKLLLAGVSDVYGEASVEVLSQTPSACTMVLPGEEGAEALSALRSILLTKLELKDPDSVATITVLGAANDPARVKPAPPKESEEPQNKPEASQKTEPSQPVGDVNRPTALERIRELMGSAEFIKLADELKLLSTRVDDNSRQALLSQSYIFAISDGYGYDDKLELFSELLDETGLSPATKDDAVAVARLESGGGEERLKAVNKLISSLDYMLRPGRVTSIDISEWMERTNSADFKRLLLYLDKREKRGVVVFRVPFVKSDVLNRIENDLADVLFVRKVRFDPLTTEQFQELARRSFAEANLALTDEAWSVFHDKIAEERQDGAFYGMSTIRKIVNETIYYKTLRMAEGGTERDVGREDIAPILRERGESEGRTGMEQLSELVGMEPIRAQVEEMLAHFAMTSRVAGLERPCLHMRFVGNPGTGKTTVARILGKILKERGVLRAGRFYECRGRDLCGRYVGETAPKTAAVCRDAYGSVLFIDEAYALFRGGDNPRDYGQEAIDTLIAEMENHRDDMVVIMAGYPADMATLMEANAGMASRMPYVVTFPDYTRAQLAEILFNMSSRAFELSEEFKQEAGRFFDGIPDDTLHSRSFGNARFVRNLYERLCAKVSLRLTDADGDRPTLTASDFRNAASSIDVGAAPRRSIGFTAGD